MFGSYLISNYTSMKACCSVIQQLSPPELGKHISRSNFRQFADGFDTPEDINDDPETAPSKRVLRAYPAYRKPLDGTLAAQAVGIERCDKSARTFASGSNSFRHWILSGRRY